MFKAITKRLVCYFRVRKRDFTLMKAWKYFWPRVGFGLLTISHVFVFWDCVPRNLETRVAPLCAYRKTIQFRLKFRSIRSPETPWKAFQPEQGPKIRSGVRLEFCCIFKPPLWNQPLGRKGYTARADSFSPRSVDKCFNLSPCFLLLKLNTGLHSFSSNPISPFLSLLLFIFSTLHDQNLGFLLSPSSQSQHLDHHSSKLKKEKAWERHRAQHFIGIKAWFEDFGAKAWVGLHCSTSSLQF